MDPGFDTHNLAMLSFDLGALNYDAPRAREFERRALEAAQTTPGVRSGRAFQHHSSVQRRLRQDALSRKARTATNGQSGHVTQFP